MLYHILRAISRRIDRAIDAHVAAALDGPTLAHVTDPPSDYGYEVARMDRESTPEFDALVRRFADLREGTYGGEDMAEWERELMWRGEDA